MYLPNHFNAPSPEAIDTLVKTYPLASLLTSAPEQPMGCLVNPVPMGLFEPLVQGARLWAHVARANPLWQHLEANPQAMAIFNGPSAYITPNSYAAKAEHHRVVPTYNYATVQVTGRLVAHHDPDIKRRIVAQLTDYHERHQPQPWSIDEAPADYMQAMLNAIVGLEFEVQSVKAKWKVNQNRSIADQKGVIAELQTRTDSPHTEQMAAIMLKNTQKKNQ
jgi:transcriptional regulator